MNTKRLFQLLLAIGAAFFAFEFVIHFFGLPILEHDKIFLPTHDRYIALYGLLHAAILLLIASNGEKYRALFVVTMVFVLAGMLNANWIAQNQWYTNNFNAPSLDANLSVIGIISIFWFLATILLWLFAFILLPRGIRCRRESIAR
jgi:hypothetical protein